MSSKTCQVSSEPIPADSLITNQTILFLSPRIVPKSYQGCYDGLMERRTVFLYGRSMLLSLVASSLANSPDLKVVHETTWGEVEAHTACCAPDVLIYDLESAAEKAILPMLFNNPRLLLIGLDVETNRAVLIAGQETHSFTMDRMRAVVEGGDLEYNPEEPSG